jgi:hypothetical protein
MSENHLSVMSDLFVSKETKFPNLPKVPVGGASAVAPRWEANRVIRVIATGESRLSWVEAAAMGRCL